VEGGELERDPSGPNGSVARRGGWISPHENWLRVEGAFLAGLSGGIGAAITYGLIKALATLPAPEGFDTPRIVPLSAVAAILSLAVAGIAAGLYPASKAAKLEPVEALRQE